MAQLKRSKKCICGDCIVYSVYMTGGVGGGVGGGGGGGGSEGGKQEEKMVVGQGRKREW